MIHLGIKLSFDAAHCIRGHSGKCANLHGHRWEVEVILFGEEIDSMGMLADFSVLKRQLMEIIGKMDHSNLNDLPPFTHVNPTAENIAKYIFEELSGRIWSKELDAPINVEEVKVWESRDSWASFKR